MTKNDLKWLRMTKNDLKWLSITKSNKLSIIANAMFVSKKIHLNIK